MKKFGILALLLLSFTACNIFESLDSKKKNSSVLEFELNEKLNDGDYQGALTIVKNLIAGNASLNFIDNYNENGKTTQDYVKEKYTDSTVQTYIKYKALEAEAYLGLSNAKMSDILAKIAEYSSSNPNYISKSSAGDDKIKIKDIIPKDISERELLKAVEAYLKSLPIDSNAYNYLKNIKGLGGKTLNSDYLSGGLALAVRSIHKALVILGFYDDPNIDEDDFEAPTWTEFNDDKIGEKTRLEVWNENAVNLKTQLEASIKILTFYVGTDDDFDLDKVLNDANDILETIKEFNDSGDGTDYNAFIYKIGLQGVDE